MMWRSTKALDLLRDPRVLVHSVVSDKKGTEGEFKLRGRAIDVPDAEERERFADAEESATGWRPTEPFHLFKLDIERAAFQRFSGEGHHSVMTWRAGGPVKKALRKWTGSGYIDAEAD